MNEASIIEAIKKISNDISSWSGASRPEFLLVVEEEKLRLIVAFILDWTGARAPQPQMGRSALVDT